MCSHQCCACIWFQSLIGGPSRLEDTSCKAKSCLLFPSPLKVLMHVKAPLRVDFQPWHAIMAWLSGQTFRDYYKGCKMLPKRHIPWHTCFLERILFKSQILPFKMPQKQQNLLSNFPYGFENVKYTFCLRFKNNPSQPPFNTLFYTFAPLYFAFLLRFCL